MGNKLCSESDRDLNFSSNDPQQILRDKQLFLSTKIKEYLEKQKPYHKQLTQKQQQLTLKRLGQNFYQGEVNMFGKPEGVGKLYRSDGSLYIGKFSSGKASGMGYLLFPNGDRYEGFFVKDQADDPQGRLISSEASAAYLGGYKHNLLNGEGQFISELVHFKGQFKNGKMKKGHLKWKQQKKSFENEYNGQFDQNQKYTGYGELKTSQGVYVGNFLAGMKSSKGRFKHNDGWVYEGEYLEDKKSGQGTLTDPKGHIKYVGMWRDNLPNGVGKQANKKHELIESTFINGIDSQQLIQTA